MTIIPNLNIVIQQGDAVRDSHNIRNQVLESSQSTVFERMADEDRKRNVVSQTEEADGVFLTNERRGNGRFKRDRKKERKEKVRAAMEKPVDPDGPGRLLNTVA